MSAYKLHYYYVFPKAEHASAIF